MPANRKNRHTKVNCLPDLIDLAWRVLSDKNPRSHVIASIEPMPTKRRFASFVSTVYAASLETEEGRRLRFSVLLAPDYLKAKYRPIFGTPPFFASELRFDEARAFNVQELRRLAPTADIRYSHILVQGYEDARQPLQITGLLESAAGRWNSRTGARAPSSSNDGIEVVVQGPARLSVCVRGTVVCVLEKTDLFVPASFSWVLHELDGVLEGIRTQSRGPAAAIQKLADSRQSVLGLEWKPLRETQRLPGGTLVPIYSCIKQMVTKIQLASHGGLLFFLPPPKQRDDDGQKAMLDIKYRLQDPRIREILRWEAISELVSDVAHVRSLYGLFRELGIEMMEHLEHRVTPAAISDALSRYTSFVASLANVDGAVVLDETLSVVGFGAVMPSDTQFRLDQIFQVSESRHDPEAGDEERFGDYVDIRRFGTRHRAAARFCRHFVGGAAIVVSQDGGAKIARCLPWLEDAKTKERDTNVVAFFDYSPLREYTV